MRKLLAIFALMSLLALPAVSASAAAAVAGGDWNVDANHSEVSFGVRHFFTPVTGSFAGYEVSLSFDRENPASSRVTAKIPVANIDTGNDKRNAHLKTADFFDAQAYPYITFESTSVKAVSDTQWVATGNLTIKDVTRQIELPIELLGVMELPEMMQAQMGGTKEIASFRASATIDRRDFGVGTGSWAETAVVGAGVELEILVEANRK